VPLLVYALRLAPHRAVCVSMVAIGATAAFATAQQLRANDALLDARTGVVLAATGMVGAPVGVSLGRRLPERYLLLLFAGVVLLVGIRMVFTAFRKPASGPSQLLVTGHAKHPQARLAGSRIVAFSGIGILTGVLAGLLGVGGGFVLVPLLVGLSKVELRRAIATSSAVVALVSVSATASHWFGGQAIPWSLAAIFTAGSVLGWNLASRWVSKLSGPRLEQLFGTVLLLTGSWILVVTL
jgi:uncharacterized protein